MEKTSARIVAGTFAAMTFAGGAFLLGYTHTAPVRAPAAEVAAETVALEPAAPTAAPTAAPAVPTAASDPAPSVAHERAEHVGGEDD
jgi:hypothetical protein